MARNRIVFEGLQELRAALRRLPQELRGDGEVIVFDEADAAAAEIRAEYEKHRRSGDLASRVKVVRLSGGSRLFAGAQVQNTSPLAFIFENGTQARHNALGANRGAMPPGHVFVPVMLRRRKDMYEKLRDMLRGKGLKVTG